MMRLIRLLLAFLALLAASAQPALAQAGTAKRIALTFDDVPRAPGPWLGEDERTVRLIAALRRAGVRQAAFFLNPGRIAERPGAVDRIDAYVAAGHVIANHTYTHPKLDNTAIADFIADIDAAGTWLGGRDGFRPWFRFPYLNEGGKDVAKRDAVRAALAARGLLNGAVTVESSDWFLENALKQAVANGETIDRDAARALYVESHVGAARFYDRLAARVLGRSPAHVMLLHETDIAALWIGDLVAALEADGWEIVTADEAFADPLYRLAPITPFAQGTLTESLAWEAGIPAPRWYERNDTKLAQKLFDQRVLGKESPREDP